MTTLDPATGRPLADSAIQRVLFICPRVHVYQIPPLTSNKGFSAGTWTAPPRPTAQMIFTARLRIIETSLSNQIKTDIVLEDPKTGDLFAACPYTSPAVVEQANDSSRFFAIRVVGEGGMKATLGMGFEERPDAFDFSITLSEARKLLGLDPASGHAQPQHLSRKTVEEPKKDFSLKEGQSIHVEIGGRGRRQQQSTSASNDDGSALFSIRPPPPPASANDFALPSLAPPPSAAHVKAASKSPSPARQQSQHHSHQNAQDLGFDDGEFGEFQ
ncbi:adaptin ear-binding coat-associated protein 2 [Aureobasidium namibiae CBS 147.97]|uniref:Adaptin ear-binding coat-associated protein 2 n=1 Tax=Aureobasidium namibiae CBS 147.97 TaxID=1043004 RepID=A0A074WMM6_9PEZI